MPPTPFECVSQWRTLRDELLAARPGWRLQHPKATLQEIETAIDARIAELRARMLEDGARASSAADVRQAQPSERPVCPQCGTQGGPRGPHERQVTTHQGHTRRWRRSDVKCPACQVGFFPPR